MKSRVITKAAATWLAAALFSMVVMATALPASACPLCKEAVPENAGVDGAPQPRIADGYFWSILFMIGTPFTIVAVMGTTFYVVLRKNVIPAAGA
jgi:hypothetical protein